MIRHVSVRFSLVIVFFYFFSFYIFKGNQIYEFHNFLCIVARVTQINPRWARCAILCVKDIVLAEPFRGQLRKEDVRATEKDRVELYQCFRPNDIILARVVSFFKEIMLQCLSRYYLT